MVPGRIRSRAAAAASLLTACALLLALSPARASSPSPEVNRAKHQLAQVKQRIGSGKAALRSLDRELNRLATEIAATQTAIARTELRIARSRKQEARIQADVGQLQRQINGRSRDAYIQGPGTGLEMVLAASSYNDLVDRVGILSEMNLRDGELAAALHDAELKLGFKRNELARLEFQRRSMLQRLGEQQKALQGKFSQQKRLLDSLRRKRDVLAAQLSAVRPFAVCPVRGPHAVADGFGAPRFAGGFHLHAGNDILAPYGTAIVAPFDGTAVAGHDELGGLTVDVYGAFGHVYNAHLSALGTLGSVATGTVIGYVGDSGDAQGGPPHDHFEWHPEPMPPNPPPGPYGKAVIRGAVDPYAFLMLVC